MAPSKKPITVAHTKTDSNYQKERSFDWGLRSEQRPPHPAISLHTVNTNCCLQSRHHLISLHCMELPINSQWDTFLWASSGMLRENKLLFADAFSCNLHASTYVAFKGLNFLEIQIISLTHNIFNNIAKYFQCLQWSLFETIIHNFSQNRSFRAVVVNPTYFSGANWQLPHMYDFFT